MQDTLHLMMDRGRMRGAGDMEPAMMPGRGMGGRGGMMGNGPMMRMMMGQMLQHQQVMQAMGRVMSRLAVAGGRDPAGYMASFTPARINSQFTG